MVNCPKCGSYNPTGSNFCSECGSSMNSNSNKSKVRKIKVESHDPKKPIGGISTNKESNTSLYIQIILCILGILVCAYLFLRGLWVEFISVIIFGLPSYDPANPPNPLRELFFMFVGFFGVPILLGILDSMLGDLDDE